MTGAELPLLGRDRIAYLLRELGQRCAGQGFNAEMLLVGGAAMALAYSRDRVTRDLDAIFEPKMAIYEQARRMADDHGLPPDWLNDAVKALMPDEADRGPQVRFTSEGISVAVASPAYMFAMKALAARQEADTDDLLTLAGLLDITTVEQALAVVTGYYRPERLAVRTSLFIEALFGADGTAIVSNYRQTGNG